MQTSEGAGAGSAGLVLSHISEQKTRVSRAKYAIEIYPSDVKVHIPKGRQSGGGPRGVVKEFSDQSRGRLLFACFNAKADWQSFWTLTYPEAFPTDGRTVKEHLHAFLVSLRREFDELDYLWALEFQQRGAAHLHGLASEFIDKEWLSRRWYEVVDSGDPRHLRAGTSIEGCSGRRQGAAYMVKLYASKRFQKEVPEDFSDVGRFWGTSRGLVVPGRVVVLDDSRESMQLVRTMRRFTEHLLRENEKSGKARARQPVRDGEKRSRKVRRAPTLANLHSGRNGFTVFEGAGIAVRLVEDLGKLGPNVQAPG